MALNTYEERILSVLKYSLRPLNTKEVAFYAKIDWATANKYLATLKRKKIISNKPCGGVNYWVFK